MIDEVGALSFTYVYAAKIGGRVHIQRGHYYHLNEMLHVLAIIWLKVAHTKRTHYQKINDKIYMESAIDKKIRMCCFSAKHGSLRSKSKNWMA